MYTLRGAVHMDSMYRINLLSHLSRTCQYITVITKLTQRKSKLHTGITCYPGGYSKECSRYTGHVHYTSRYMKYPCFALVIRCCLFHFRKGIL